MRTSRIVYVHTCSMEPSRKNWSKWHLKIIPLQKRTFWHPSSVDFSQILNSVTSNNMKNSAADAEGIALREKLGYIDEKQLFRLLMIAPGTGRNRSYAGDLPPAYKIGKQRLYKLAEVDAWIRRRRVKSNP
jgi:hypothetical protein